MIRGHLVLSFSISKFGFDILDFDFEIWDFDCVMVDRARGRRKPRGGRVKGTQARRGSELGGAGGRDWVEITRRRRGKVPCLFRGGEGN